MTPKPKTYTMTRQDLEALRRLIRYISTTDPEIQNLAVQYDNALTKALQTKK